MNELCCGSEQSYWSSHVKLVEHSNWTSEGHVTALEHITCMLYNYLAN